MVFSAAGVRIIKTPVGAPRANAIAERWVSSRPARAAPAVREILKDAGIDPAPRRAGPAWPQFLRSQAGAILACDFFTADLPDGTRAFVLAASGHATRRIRIPGVTVHPAGARAARQARNLLMDLGEQAHRAKFMIRDRGSDYTAASGAVLADAGIRTVLCKRPDAADECHCRTLDRGMPARASRSHPHLE